MIQSNTLSQQPDFILEKDTDNENMTLLLDNLFLNLLDTTLQDQVLELGKIDDFLKTFSITDPPFRNTDDWKLEVVDGRNTLFYKDRNYIPNDLNLQHDMVQMLHDHITPGHPGEAETLVAV